MPIPFKLALIQMQVVGGDRAGNLDRAVARIAEAAGGGADVALLPECLDVGWTDPASQTYACAIPGGDACARLTQAARDCGIDVCAGITEEDQGRVYNTAVYIDWKGSLLGRHRKVNELEIGHPYYAQGGGLNVVETRFGTAGLLICADAFAEGHVLSRGLGYLGADFILSPCAWAVEAEHDNALQPYWAFWHEFYGPVCAEFSLWIAACSNVGPLDAGPWAGRRCIGCSMVVDAEGLVTAKGPYGVEADTIVYADIAPLPRPARGCGWARRR